MFTDLKRAGRLTETIFLTVASVLCLSLSVFRVSYTHSWFYLFLNWNLFLAFVPWLFSSIMVVYPKLRNSKIAVVLLLCCWLLFFPNAPYILTDLFHLRLKSVVPVWFDLVLVISYAWTGLLFGFMSLLDIEKMLRSALSARWVTAIVVLLLFVSSFGIYIGRYLRWNSWDVVRSPFSLLSDIADRFIHPLDHPRTWGMTILMGILLNMIYWSIHLLRNRKIVNS